MKKNNTPLGIKFEVASGWENKDVKLPSRSTEGSAGYDFKAVEDITIPSIWDGVEGATKVHTGVKAKFHEDIVLKLFNRSSLGIKSALFIPNSVGIIDSDYYGNPQNDGEVIFAFINFSTQPYYIKKGDKIGQGLFEFYLTTDDDGDTVGKNKRLGGFGSTGS